MCYDKTGLRLITGEADKTIKMYKEDEEAVSCFSEAFISSSKLTYGLLGPIGLITLCLYL